MKNFMRPLFGLGLLALALSGALVANEDVTLEGSFVWARDEGDISGDLSAVMTPAGENQWSVAFHFVWEDEPHTYLGTASGSLTHGELEGVAESDNEDHKISFRFNGAFEDGTFTGTHGWIKEDGTLETAGTLTLSQPQ